MSKTTGQRRHRVEAEVGVIGGSGLYEMEGLRQIREVRVRTPFGDPSDAITVGVLEGGEAPVRVAFLSRHGRGHQLSPTAINYRANIYALKALGVQQVLSVSAVGSMKEQLRPGDVVLPHQFIDLTKRRVSTFFDDGIVAHVGFSDPVCPGLATVLFKAAQEAEARVHAAGVYICIEGPQFSTRAESLLYRQWGVDVIGMTNLPEAKLAREAELCYATVALVTDYDCWHDEEAAVTVDGILETLRRNVALARRMLRTALPLVVQPRPCACRQALEHAILTDSARLSPAVRRRLGLLLRRPLGLDRSSAARKGGG